MRRLLIDKNITVNNFDLLRFVLATAVIYSHCYVIFYGKLIDTEPFMVFSRNQLDLGGLAVDCFFIISGFLIVRSFEYSPLKTYFQKRILRIVPGFVVAYLISLLIVGPLGTIDATHPFGDWYTYFQKFSKKLGLLHLITLQKPIAYSSFQKLPLPAMVNESLWTIQYEFLCYLSLPLIGLLGFVKRRWILASVFVVAYLMVVGQKFFGLFYWSSYTGSLLSHPVILPRLLMYFLSGSVVYLFRDSIRLTRPLLLLSVVALLFSCQGYSCFDQVMPIAGTYLLFYVAYHPRLQFSDFSRRGDFSYGLYLYGWPIQQLLLYFLAQYLNPYRLFLLAFPLALLAAYFSWHLIEKPFLRLKSKNLWTLPKRITTKEPNPLVPR